MKGHMQDGKFHPHTEYKKGTRKSRDQQVKTQGVRMKKSDGSRIKKLQFKVWKYEDAPEDLQEKIIENLRQKKYEYGDDYFADYDGMIYDKKTEIADYDVFSNYSKKYYDLDRGQYIQFPDLEIKDEKKFAKMIGVPESLRKKIDFGFVNEGERTTELKVYDETGDTITDGDDYDEYKKYANEDYDILTKSEFEKVQQAIEKWSDLMHNAWVGLRDSYEYQFTDEALKEDAISNDYEFNEDGEIA